MRKGFTLIELISVIVIFAVLAAILMPVFAKAKLESKASASKLNIKGFWQGLVLYQADNDQKTDYGTPENMGLPPVRGGWFNFVNQYTGDPTYGWSTKKKYVPCGTDNDEDLPGLGITYMPGMYDDWIKEVVKLQENTVVMMDKNCNVKGTRVLCQFCQKRSIGVTLGGEVRDKKNSNWSVLEQEFYQ